MKLISTSTATSATATSENANWPAANVLETALKKSWRAASSSVMSAMVSVVMQGTMDSVAIMGIAADALTVSITDPNAIAWESGTEWEAGTAWATSGAISPQEILLEPLAGTTVASTSGLRSAAWFEFPEFTGICVLRITVANTTGRPLTLSIGTVFPGLRGEYSSARYGMTVNEVDHSIEREMAAGNIYYKPRSLVREFAFTLMIIEQTIYDALWNMVRSKRRISMPMVLVNNYGTQWLIIGRIRSMRGTLESYRYTPIDLVVREEI